MGIVKTGNGQESGKFLESLRKPLLFDISKNDGLGNDRFVF